MIRGLIFSVFFFFVYFQAFVWGATITDANKDDPLVRLTDLTPDSGFGGGPVPLFAEAGEGTSGDNAIKVYVPVESSHSGGNTGYFMGSVLPDISSGSMGTGVLEFNLNVAREGVNQYLHVGLEVNSGRYKIIKGAIPITTDDDDLEVSVSFNELCAVTEFGCSQFVDSTEPPINTSNSRLIFFLSEMNQGTGEIEEVDYSVKVFYEIFISSRIDNSNQINQTDLLKGDGELYVSYNGFGFAHLDSVYAYIIENSSDVCTVGDLANLVTYAGRTMGGSLVNLETELLNGEARIKNLSNGKCYAVRILYADKFRFASRLSARLAEYPESILALLEKQACFFLTAGFGREHFIVDFFRDFRDRVLKKFFLGRVFIDFYYAVAPSYAPYVLENRWLAAVVRCVSYVLYGLIHYWFISFFLIGLSLVQFFRLKRTLKLNR